ncbi:Dedicator of cytokinesis protein 3 [Desmophyllum pertusum]|uniref:Dedicator of cytokinesis protein 3 n=1 Tax=Desmophyllum pertusum TaxID=174260 RepID=A0A9W9ZQR8_9CNID|nr:Dedicator of cytokinesis protein 3 [Desmophyllum pertusum]
MAAWKATSDAKYGVVVYNFDGNITYGLRLTIGETVHILEECAGWYRGCTLRNKAVKGIFPATYVRIKDCSVENAGTSGESVVPKEDATVKELTLILREWSVIWKDCYRTQKVRLFEALKTIMWDLVECRQKLLSGTLTQDQMDDIKKKTITKIDWGNSKMGLDLIPRVDGEVVDADSTSVVELYKVHVSSAEANLQVSGRGNFKKRASRGISTVIHHAYLNMTRFGCSIDEKCQLFFSIYDAREGRFISERFLVAISKSDSTQKVNQPQKIDNSTCVFTDLGSKDISAEAYLVAHIVRVGRMLPDGSSKKVSTASYRRPFGCAVLDIVDVLTGKEELLEEKEFHMPIFTCSDSDFWTVHDSIIKKQTSKYSVPSSNSGIHVSLRVLHGDLDKIQSENPLLLPKGIPIVRKLGFPDVIMPGDIRNDIYVTMERGEFEKGSGKTTSKNVEVSMCVIGPKGKVIEDCVFLGAGGSSLTEYQSIIFYHNSSPKWNETIKIQLPFDKFLGSHLRFGFRHLSKFEEKEKSDKTFGFSFESLMRKDGTTVPDGTHDLCVYKYDENCFYDSMTYLHMPSSLSQMANHANSGSDRLVRNSKDTFFIRTIVCSTKLTQNVDLVGLLRWRSQKRQVPSVLTSLLKIDGEEIVKFLQDIFDALFAILNESAEQYGNLVFQALVFIICILSNEKYQHFQGVLTTYIDKHFSAAMAHKKLISCLRQVLNYTGENDKMENLKNTMMALECLFKFIIQSRMLLISMHRGRDVTSQDLFRQDLWSVFTDLNELMSSRLPDVTVQSLAMQHFAGIYQDTLKVFSIEELSMIAKQFLLSAARDQKALTSSKLQFIDATVKSELFVHKESRTILMPVLVTSIQQQLMQKQDMRRCAETLGSILTSLTTGTAKGPIEEDVYLIVRTLLQPVFQTVMTVDRTSELARHFLAVLTNLLWIMTDDHYQQYLKEFRSNKELKDFLVNVFVVFIEIVKRGIFLRDWIVIIVLGNSVILRAIQNFSQALVDNFSEDNFDYQLWNSYFNLSVSFLTQSHLQLENFTEVKKNKIIDRYGDMRQVMGFEIVNMWQTLGSFQRHFMLTMVCPFLEMTLVPETELRKATLPIFFDMVECELKSKGMATMVETKIVNELDRLVSVDRKGDKEYKKLFKQILTEKFEDGLLFCEEGLAFVSRVTDLLELLLDYRRVSAEDDREQKMSCLVHLLEFYEKIGREDMYIRCINRLCDLHIAAENFTEAGITFLKHAELLKWPETLDDSPDSLKDFQLKEKLYLDAIEFLDKGKTWEKAIELCKELTEQYESPLFDFIKLGDILKKQAKFFDNIIKQVRPESEYYRVGFYGKGFPSSVRNKAFVYRGQEYEKLGSFNQRLKAQFPDGLMMDKNTPPEDDILESNKQYLQCCRVLPISEHEERFSGKAVDDKIAGYYRVNDVRRFTNSRPLRPGLEDFGNLWLERTTYTICSPLPGILRWFQITSSESVEISPLLNAVETVESKNKELNRIITNLLSDKTQSINPLGMILNGIIDAAVMGGIAKYEEAFFGPEYLKKNPKDKQLIDQLKRAIDDQVKISERGLELHDELVTENLRPFHNKMETCFADMKARVTGEERRSARPKDLQIPLPPIPVAQTLRLKKDGRKQSLPSDVGRESIPVAIAKQRRQSELPATRQSLWYDDQPANKISGSKSLEALSEIDEFAPPVPKKGSRSDLASGQSPDSVRRRTVPRGSLHQRSSSPAGMLRMATSPQNNRETSPAIPPKRKSILVPNPTDNSAPSPPPLPTRTSGDLPTNFVVNGAEIGNEAKVAPPASEDNLPALPPKKSVSRMSVEVNEPPVPEKPKRPVTLTSPVDDLEPPPMLPEKRKSYASTLSLTSSRASSVFSDSVPDFTCPLSPLFPSNPTDRLGNVTPQPFARDSRGSSLPSGSSISTISPTTPRPGGFTSQGSSSSGPNGYSYVTPPTSPRVPYAYVSSPNASVASWVSESTNYFSASSSFDSDILSPGSPPKRGFNTGTLPPLSTPMNEDLFAGTSPTKNDSTPLLIPFKEKQNFSTIERVENWSFTETTSTVTSSTTVGSRDEQAKPRTPVPAPRRNTLASSSRAALSRSCSDASDGRSNIHGFGQGVTPPEVKPRTSLYFPTDHNMKSPPPKPPRPSQSVNKLPPPMPKPYASKSAESSPATQRKALNADMHDIPPSEGNGT